MRLEGTRKVLELNDFSPLYLLEDTKLLRTGTEPLPLEIVRDMREILTYCRTDMLPYHDYRENAGERHSFATWKIIVDAARVAGNETLLSGKTPHYICQKALNNAMAPNWYCMFTWGLTQAETKLFVDTPDTSFELREFMIRLFQMGMRITSSLDDFGWYKRMNEKTV